MPDPNEGFAEDIFRQFFPGKDFEDPDRDYFNELVAGKEPSSNSSMNMYQQLDTSTHDVDEDDSLEVREDDNDMSYLEKLGDRFENAEAITKETVFEMLDELGAKLVPELRRNTPRSTGGAALSTRHRVIESGSDTGVSMDLELIQRAKHSYQGTSYHYWYTLHHGLSPAGSLKQTYPASSRSLENWVSKTFNIPKRTPAFKKKLKAIRWNMYKKGIEPNTYIQDTLDENRELIDEVSTKLGIQILEDVTTLPNV